MIEYSSFKDKFMFYFDEYGIKYNERIIKDFYLFTDYLLSENEKYNLTAIKDIDEVIVKHYIDSVIILKYFDIPENSKIIDIGTGAGFPALPLSIMREDLRITFLDSSGKKINFIKKYLGSNDRFVFYTGRAEDFGRDLQVRETYDFAVSRAVAKLNVLCELAAPFIKTGGSFIAYKGKSISGEINETKNALKILGLEITKIKEFDLNNPLQSGLPPSTSLTPPSANRGALEREKSPASLLVEGGGSAEPEGVLKNNNKRVLIEIKKFAKTSSKYPRNFSNITKNPL